MIIYYQHWSVIAQRNEFLILFYWLNFLMICTYIDEKLVLVKNIIYVYRTSMPELSSNIFFNLFQFIYFLQLFFSGFWKNVFKY